MMSTLKPAVLERARPAAPVRNQTYIPKQPPPTPITGPTNNPLELGSLTISSGATASLPNIHETTTLPANDQITTHVLNQSTGKPAAGLRASLTSMTGGGWDAKSGTRSSVVFTGMTDANGRISSWYSDGEAMTNILDEHTSDGPGAKKVWVLKLESEDYWQILGQETFLPEVEVKFYIDAATEGGASGHWHIPVLLGQWGYTIYRGS